MQSLTRDPNPMQPSFLLACVGFLVVIGCQGDSAPAPPKSEPIAKEQATPQAWPASLKPFGDGFPKPGDPCRKVGESVATSDYLDHTSQLVGCLRAEDAARLGGRIVGIVDTVTLVAMPAERGAPSQ